jgi:hypothetical protein
MNNGVDLHRTRFSSAVMRAIFLIVVFLFMGGPLYAQAQRVGGPAGAEVDVWYDGSCYWANNRASRKVTVRLGPYAAILNPGQRFKFTGFGSCFSSFGATEAFYEPTPAPPPLRQLRHQHQHQSGLIPSQ